MPPNAPVTVPTALLSVPVAVFSAPVSAPAGLPPLSAPVTWFNTPWTGASGCTVPPPPPSAPVTAPTAPDST